PTLYLMYNCSNVQSCFEGVNRSNQDTETITYTNESGFSEFVYLAVDSGGNVSDYILDVSVE
ncbi:MAG: hypothetical protein KC621_28900, partial [Myxococcales bacterium]|nr:hypothetical protein [Myxococcales bacterium]